MPNYDLVVSFFHPSGAHYGTLPLRVEERCYKIALSKWDVDGLFDWSFIRDADDATLAAIVAEANL